MRESDALDLEVGTFSHKDPRLVAEALKRAAERPDTRRKAGPFQSSMCMLNFYINRAGSKLSSEQKQVLEQAKVELRKVFGRVPND